MNLNLLMSALRARFNLFLLVLLITVLATLVVSLILPKSYVATVSLLVDGRDEQSMSSGLIPLRERTGFMQTQIDLIQSHRVARKVVEDLRLASRPEIREAFEEATQGNGAIEDWLAENLIEKLKVESSQSSMLQLSYSSTNPQFSADVANAFARAYEATVLQLRTEPASLAAKWFDEQVKGLRNNVEQAQTRLAAYLKEKGIVGTPDSRFDDEGTRLNELSAQYARAQEQSYDAQARSQQARAFLARGGALDRVPEIQSNGFIQSLRSELLRGEARLQELSAHLGPAHPSYQRQVAENQGMRSRLDAEMKKIIDSLDTAARQSAQREAEFRNAMAAQRTRMLNLRSASSELGVLTRDVEAAQRAYDTASSRATNIDIESRASRTNVAVLNPAVEPREAARPRVGLNVALAVIIGCLLGLAVVFLMEMQDRRVRSLGDLRENLKFPVLGEINARPSGRLPGPVHPALPRPA